MKKLDRPYSQIIRDQKRFAIETLRDLIAIPTPNPPGENYERCAQFLAEHLRALGMETRVIKVPWEEQSKLQPGYKEFPRYNVIARWDVGAKKTLHFNAHYDVVPVSGSWKYGPFEPKVSGGWVYGRGSADMKGSIASLLHAIRSLKRTALKPGVNVEVSFTADEETGGQLGAGYIVKKKLVKADYAVVMEGGERLDVGVGHNGVLWLEGRLTGKSAHGALPHMGINAFEHMNLLGLELAKLRPVLNKRSFRLPGGEPMKPTINLGGVFGCGNGSKVNTVPAEARFTIDRRLLPNEKLAAARKEILAAVSRVKKKVPQLKLEFDTLFACDPCATSPKHPFATQAKSILRNLKGSNCGNGICVGFTDLHYFVVDGKIPGIGYGPPGENYHGVNERTKITEILDAAEVYAAFITDLV